MLIAQESLPWMRLSLSTSGTCTEMHYWPAVSTLTIAVTSPVISHAMIVSGLTQQTKPADYQSADVTSVAVNSVDSLSATGSVAHEGCSQCLLG